MVEPQKLILLKDKFFSDPDWRAMEELILEYIEPLKDMSSVDTTQPAEHVKAEIVGRLKAYESLSKFLKDSQIIKRLKPEQTKSQFT